MCFLRGRRENLKVLAPGLLTGTLSLWSFLQNEGTFLNSPVLQWFHLFYSPAKCGRSGSTFRNISNLEINRGKKYLFKAKFSFQKFLKKGGLVIETYYIYIFKFYITYIFLCIKSDIQFVWRFFSFPFHLNFFSEIEA